MYSNIVEETIWFWNIILHSCLFELKRRKIHNMRMYVFLTFKTIKNCLLYPTSTSKMHFDQKVNWYKNKVSRRIHTWVSNLFTISVMGDRNSVMYLLTCVSVSCSHITPQATVFFVSLRILTSHCDGKLFFTYYLLYRLTQWFRSLKRKRKIIIIISSLSK